MKTHCTLFKNGVDDEGNLCRMEGQCPSCTKPRLSHARYIGAKPNLQGELALIKDTGETTVKAQFDSADSPLGFGWHEFHRDDFALIRDVVATDMAEVEDRVVAFIYSRT